MRIGKTLAPAVARLAVLGAAAVALSAAPGAGHAASVNAAARAALSNATGSPNQELTAQFQLMEQVAPGSTLAFLKAVQAASDTSALAVALEALAAGDPTRRAVIQETLAALVTDPRLSRFVAGADCAADAADIRPVVRIWCNLASVDPPPIGPQTVP